jgi:hypothetical protein
VKDTDRVTNRLSYRDGRYVIFEEENGVVAIHAKSSEDAPWATVNLDREGVEALCDWLLGNHCANFSEITEKDIRRVADELIAASR